MIPLQKKVSCWSNSNSASENMFVEAYFKIIIECVATRLPTPDAPSNFQRSKSTTSRRAPAAVAPGLGPVRVTRDSDGGLAVGREPGLPGCQVQPEPAAESALAGLGAFSINKPNSYYVILCHLI